ncbi:DNA polymerase III subunit epsilon [Candidatus Thiodictyon syntrophicum]|jgi:DNA polymerase-3 subunit epsilon|uniref:DNA polymerase III subunit epsilon n=1 Tax=Candidatus Thiodictyon syntrophicum TaxID=1166950 RepID=A0A2K8UCA3_9GAMM|nr:DNA polymerase III subunit epsilon [Candidatus Thiodictyon syntrophicum]AUB83059.1 DNA polymerase III subunit epsilon [Candidatus Thiodictyon syntrophicum]
MRQIVLDTETTGLDPREGHRLIEIGCIELIDRRLTRNNFHQYLQPDREIDAAAVEVHGITNESLRDKPRFAEIAEAFLEYVTGAELIIHNAAFDCGFIDSELKRWRDDGARINALCAVTDTLALARRLHPGQRNSLDALCKRYSVDNSHRDLHGALLDAEILADVYLAMTGGQVVMHLGGEPQFEPGGRKAVTQRGRLDPLRPRLRVVAADAQAQTAHGARLAAIDRASSEGCLWLAEEPVG